MDGSGKKSLSSTPTKRLSFSEGADENDQNYQGWSLNVQNPKKPLTTTATKHFMSSTISAASKGNPPRKKILAERNGFLDSTHLQKTPTFGSKTSSSIGFGEYEENALLDHLSSRPYGPSTNYISPRPTFLRYKPHRLRDIFLRRENEAREESSSCCCGGSLESNNDKDVEDELGTSSLADGTQEDDVEKEVVDENEEEFEEVEEERCWSLKGVLKFLLLLVVLVLSNSYISSMNSPTPSPVMQAFGNPKNGSHMIQDHVYGLVNDLVSGNRDYTLVQNGAGIDEKEMMDYEAAGEGEYDDELDEPVEKQNGESEVLNEAEEKETIEGFVEGGETEAKEFIEHEEKGEIAKLGSVVESQAEERAPEMVEASDVSDECLTNVVAMNHELHITEATTMSESPFINDGVGSLAITSSIPENFENEVANEPVKQEMIDGGIGSGWSTTSDQPEYYQIQSDEAEEGLKEEELKKEKAVVVFSTLFLVIACLTSAFHFKRKRNAQKNFTPASFEPVVVQKCISMFASEENCKGTYQRPVPSVVFLGEFEVGEISSLRSRRMRENEVIKTPPPLSHGRFTTETHSVPVHAQSAFSETPRPPLSYGRFTTEEKIVKKQRGVDEENKNNAVTTPVRRSSRIQNRSIISP